ncbi:unnamed protein product [Rotaria socialis]|uniref:Uncharacterized protein n=1 Tax=Rotaria socialis TaxID=392032 RepID=A0A817VU14_9BILA|nr:unnamed protein product [Rotaria socialis]CAF3345670.1 unnamed protein product [Rotaria socialis]CAF3506321.1 unnamed protein product [Rotaria socialis]CAF3614458.1 unnamed protein product [Rotaria socialis]CAF3780285.1 unnamed protein product [Rotaria socialis]
MNEHHNELSEQLNQTEDHFNELKMEIDAQKRNPCNHTFMKQIDEWENQSIEKIHQLANEIRLELSSNVTRFATDLDTKLKQLTKEVIQCRQEQDFIDTDIQRCNEELKQLKDTLNSPPDFIIENEQTSFINKIRLSLKVTLNANTKWMKNGVTVAGGNGQDNGMNQLSNPHSLYVDDDQTVYIADFSNNRIMKVKYGETIGEVVAGGNGQGKSSNQLSNPTDVIIDKVNDSFIICDFGNKRVVRWPRQNGKNGETVISNIRCHGLTMDENRFLYVADSEKHEVRRFRIGENKGTIVAGGNGSGNRLDQLYYPTYVFVDREHSVYVSDRCNHRVMKWMKDAKQGMIVAGGQGQGNSLTQLSHPDGIFVDQSGNVYMSDRWNDRIMRWCQGATQGSVIAGGNDRGNQLDQFYGPIGLSFDREGNMYVTEDNNHRVQKFNNDQS